MFSMALPIIPAAIRTLKTASSIQNCENFIFIQTSFDALASNNFQLPNLYVQYLRNVFEESAKKIVKIK
jgi:hypothetical protein